ncbi:MAG: serine hydrolase domain-containing protein [Myxococcota bacterium]
MQQHAITTLLENGREAGIFPAAQASVLCDSQVVHESAHGLVQPGGTAVTSSTLFDIASVTKVLATTACLMTLVDQGEVALDAPLTRYVPNAPQGPTIRELLGHRSGLPAWGTFFMHSASVLTQVCSARADADRRRVYSDLGFILLGATIEAVTQQPLHMAARELVLLPLGLSRTGYRPRASSAPDPSIAVTGLTRPRRPAPGQEALYTVPEQPDALVPGEVDDDNAWAMGGVAGHAGLFSTARDVARFGACLLEDLEGASHLASSATVRTFFAIDAPHLHPIRSLGFDRATPPRSSCGTRFGAGPLGAVGHLGFTGCSLWIDLDRRISAALLTNRVFPTRENVAIKTFRPAFHDTLIASLVSDSED